MKAWMLLAATSVFALASTANADTSTELHLHQDLHDDLSKKQVRKMYLGQTKYLEDGTRLTLTCLETGELHRAFLKQWVGMTPSQFKIHWQKKLFTGKGRMPYRFKNNSNQQGFVNNTPGAVGYKAASSQDTAQSGPSYFDPKTARYIKAKRS